MHKGHEAQPPTQCFSLYNMSEGWLNTAYTLPREKFIKPQFGKKKKKELLDDPSIFFTGIYLSIKMSIHQKEQLAFHLLSTYVS